MSFNVDLWNGFEVIKSSFDSNLNKLNQLINILDSYSFYVKEYYTNLFNLYSSTNKIINKDNSTFDNLLYLLLISFKTESEYYENHYNLINKSLQETKERIEKIKLNIQQYFQSYEINKENFNNALNNLISKQENFYESCKELCLNIAQEETNKIFIENQNNINNKKRSSTENLKIKIEKKETPLDCVFLAKSNYIKFIFESNKLRENYNNNTENILIKLENQYKDILYYFECLMKIYINDKIMIHNKILTLNNNSNEKTFKNINYETIFNDFIENNVTKEFPMIKLEFIPFKLTKNIFENNQKLNNYNELKKEEQNKIFNLIKNYISENNINLYESDFSKIFLKSKEQKNLLKSNEVNLDETKTIIEIDEDDFEIIKSKKKKEIEKKKKNFNFIKNFINTLVIEETESNKKEEEKENENVIDIDESIKYNKILVKFMDLISPKNKEKFEYLNAFIQFLTIVRVKGLFKLNPYVYQIFINIFTYILMNYKNSYDYIRNIILLSQTFYKGDDENPDDVKIYLLNGLKNHSVFKEPQTWHRAINYSLSLSIKNSSLYKLEIQNKEDYYKNLDKIVLNIFISYLYDMRISTTDLKVYEKVKHFYSKIYKLDEKMVDEQVNKLFEINSKKEKNDKLENKIEDNNINENK
mgnify:CR=1 FL=1